MERMEKWFAGLKDRPLLQAGIGAVCLALLLLYIAFPYTFTKTYTPDEITPELCEKIYRDAYDTDEGMFHFIGTVQADDEIIAGLVIYLSPRSFTSPHAIRFYKIEEKTANMPSVIFPLLTILLHAYSNLGEARLTGWSSSI